MKKLFYEDEYLKEWETKIVKIEEDKDKFYIVLQETAFYPEGGGQPSDYGEIDGIEVIDVQEKNDTIYHITKTKPNNKFVKCKLDYIRRFDLMQQHTGQHLFSAVFYNKYRGETSSFHLGVDYVSIDISINDISPEMAKDVENIANDYIFRNLDIITHVVTENQINQFPLRKLPPASDVIRIVEIDGIDFSPCCGTHVKRTGEIGIIKIIKTEKYKGATRIYLKCGRRALMDFQNKIDITLNLGKLLSVPENEIQKSVENNLQDIKESMKKMAELKERLFMYEGDELISSSDTNLIIKLFKDKTIGDIQLLTRQILEKGNYILIFGSFMENKILLSHNGSTSIDFGKLLKVHLSNFSGRGGGNSKQAQAAFENAENLNKFVEHIKSIIN